MRPRVTTLLVGIAALAAAALFLRRLGGAAPRAVESPSRVPYELGL